MLAASNK